MNHSRASALNRSDDSISSKPLTAGELLDPVAVHSHLHNTSIDEISEVFGRTRMLGQAGWMAAAVCVGRAQEKAARGSRVIDSLAATFGLHRSRIARLGRIYKLLLRPRIEAGRGVSRALTLKEQAWYEIAAEAGRILSRSPSELLNDAEERKQTNPRYSTRRWKIDLGLVAAEQDRRDEFGSLLERHADTDESVAQDAASRLDEAVLDAALAVIEHTRIGIRQDRKPGFGSELMVIGPDGIIHYISPAMAEV